MPLTWRVLDRQPVKSLDDYIAMGGGTAAHAALQARATEIIEVVSASGLRGRGGAGFPTGPKWTTVAAARTPGAATTIVVNAAEGEPGTFKDRALLRTNPYRVLEGAIVGALAMQTDEIRIGIKATFGREIERLTGAISEMRTSGWLDDLNIEVVLGPSSYLFGEETALLEVIEGRQPFPRVTPPYRRGLQAHDTRSAATVALATTDGSGGAPALVDNAETLANIPLIVDHGAEWFRAVGSDDSPGTIVCTVSGATRRSGVREMAMGSTLREVIDAIGWGARPGREIQVVLAGTSNPLIPSRLLDTPLTYEALRDAGSGLGSAGFIVFDDTTDPAAVAAGVARFLSVESCGQCEPCKIDGLSIAEELRSSLRSEPTMDVNTLRRRIDTVTEGARCNLAQQQASVASSLLELFPNSGNSRPHARPASTLEPVMIAPIVDLVGGRALLDTRQLDKQPDWSYDRTDSGAAPAARLGNTPVHIDRQVRSREWPEWRVGPGTEHPLDVVVDAHEAIDALIDRALVAGAQDLERRVEEVAVAIRTHVDVTQRVLYPMLRRVGGDAGDLLADEAEAQERTLSSLIRDIEPSAAHERLRDVGVEMHAHACLDDDILEVLRRHLDPIERSRLADGLAAARVTTTMNRPGPTASRPAAPSFRRLATKPPEAALLASGRPPTDEPRLGSRPAPLPAPDTAPPVGTTQTTWEVTRMAPVVARPAQRNGTGSSADEAAGIHTILVGVNGSPPAAAALGWASQLARRVGAEIVLANVFESGQSEVPPDDHERLVAEAERRLNAEWSEPLRGSGVRYRGLQLVGPPDTLLTAAEAENADLLAVGTRAPGRFAALHVGSLAHHLTHYTLGPLAIVPIAGAAASLERIVLGVDGSAGSEAAVRWCARAAAACEAEVIAVCAFESRTRWAAGDDMKRWRAAAEAAITSEWIAPLRSAGVTVRTRIVEANSPESALEAAAADEGAGILVVGTQEPSEVTGLRVGRVPLHLAHHTHLPLVIVPPIARKLHSASARSEAAREVS